MIKAPTDKILQSRREPLVLVGKLQNFNIAVDSNRPQKPSSYLNTFDLLDSKKEDLHPEFSELVSTYKAKAKFSYAPSEPDELTFSKNDIIDIFGHAKVDFLHFCLVLILLPLNFFE